jgi:hypothetical protein
MMLNVWLFKSKRGRKMFKMIRNQLVGLLLVLLGCTSLLVSDGDFTGGFIACAFGIMCYFTKEDAFEYAYLKRRK